jgi:hypothetical protein
MYVMCVCILRGVCLGVRLAISHFFCFWRFIRMTYHVKLIQLCLNQCYDFVCLSMCHLYHLVHLSLYQPKQLSHPQPCCKHFSESSAWPPFTILYSLHSNHIGHNKLCLASSGYWWIFMRLDAFTHSALSKP